MNTSKTVVRKTKSQASTYNGRNGLIWGYLDERMDLLAHLKVIVPVGINLVEFGRPKQNQQICSSMFLLEGTDYRG